MNPDIAPRRAALDGLRGIAIALVLLYHMNWLAAGWIGVQLFFVLSGYLITAQLLRLRGEHPGTAGWGIYLGRRALRIFPLYYLFLLVAVIAANNNDLLAQLPYAASYTLNWRAMAADLPRTQWLDHLWSLSIEEQFYLLWPLLVLQLPATQLRPVLYTLILFAPLLRWGVASVWTAQHWTAAAPIAVAYNTLSHLDAFALGALLSTWSLPAATQGHARYGWALFAIALVPIWIIGAAVNGPGLLPVRPFGAWLTLGYPNALPLAAQFLWGYSLIGLLCAALLWLSLHNPPRLLSWRPLTAMGRLSYGLYLIHYPLAHLMAPLVHVLGEHSGLGFYTCLALWSPLYLLVLLALAAGVHRVFEQPILSLRERWFRL